MRKTIFFISLLFIVFNGSFAAEKIAKSKTALFKIGRSKDANEIYYTVKITPDGNLDLKNPIRIYWIKFTKNGAIEPGTCQARVACSQYARQLLSP